MDFARGGGVCRGAARSLAGDRLRSGFFLQHVQPEAGREIPPAGLHESELHGQSRVRHLRSPLRKTRCQAGPDDGRRQIHRQRSRMPRLVRNRAGGADQQRLSREHDRGEDGHMDPIKILTANIDKPNSTSIDVYLDAGGYKAAEKALKMKPDEVTQLVKDSELRGRGGAGFPTGAKWGFVPKNAPNPTYLLCNADESEPGTFKD